MKQLSNLFFFVTLLSVVVLLSCKKDENRIYLEGGTPPALTSSVTGNTLPLSFTNKDNQAIMLSWTNPAYTFTTGVSSQSVTYQIEIDTTGANFTNPNKKTISISNNLSQSFTQGEFNDFLLNGLELKAGISHAVEIRIKSFLGASSATLLSNVLKFNITPYAIPPKVEPYSTDVYMVGDATTGGWDNPVPDPAQKMTQISPTLYEITMPLNAGKSYLFLPVNGSWSQKYGFDGANNSNNPDGGDFKREGGDIKAPEAGGNYKIELNFQTGKFKVTKV
jgi:hypothetical protein